MKSGLECTANARQANVLYKIRSFWRATSVLIKFIDSVLYFHCGQWRCGKVPIAHTRPFITMVDIFESIPWNSIQPTYLCEMSVWCESLFVERSMHFANILHWNSPQTGSFYVLYTWFDSYFMVINFATRFASQKTKSPKTVFNTRTWQTYDMCVSVLNSFYLCLGSSPIKGIRPYLHISKIELLTYQNVLAYVQFHFILPRMVEEHIDYKIVEYITYTPWTCTVLGIAGCYFCFGLLQTRQ